MDRTGDHPLRAGGMSDMLIEAIHGEYRECRIPGLVRTGHGTLLGYYECRDSTSDWARIDLKIIRSTDGGESWETVLLIPGEGHTLNNPVMIVDGETVHFLYCRDYKELFYRRSSDDGVSFSETRDITHVFRAHGFYNAAAVGPGHGIVHKGDLIVAAWFSENHDDPMAHRPTKLRTVYSPDGGETWILGGVVGRYDLKDPNESALALLPDNRVLISIRHRNLKRKCRVFGYSETGRADWYSVHYRDDIPDPVCMGSMTSAEDGTMFHINCAAKKTRTNLTLRVSEDGFATYRDILVDEIAGYSDVAVDAQTKTAYILYERDADNGGLYFKKLNYAE